MNGLSIKVRVTLWYAALMVVLVALTLALIFGVSESVAETSARNGLIRAVEDSLDEVEYDDGKLDVDDDLDFFSHGVYLSVYDANLRQVYGRMPKQFVNPPAFAAGIVRTVDSGGDRWYVYDGRVSDKNYGDVWVRGVAALSDSENRMHTMLSIAGIALPFLVVVAALGGYLITRRAFLPVREISEAAEQIGEGRDLSRRIRIGRGKDEISALANTFNDMFGRLERAFERERQFTSDASHELRTPVSVILSQGEYALESANTLEEARGALSIILAQAQKMSGLIAQLLTLSRIDRGHGRLSLELLNLSELAEMVADDRREAAADKSIEIRTNIAPGLRVHADETLMLRMLINLVSNAITYGKPGGHVTIGLAANGKEIVGSVADDGIGIPEEHLPRIWERFYQVDPSRTAGREGGVGLGLSMVKWIVEAHGGRIAVSSGLGEGTEFTFVFPMAD